MVNAETALALSSEKVWHEKLSYEDAETKYQEQLAKVILTKLSLMVPLSLFGS